jgi:SAM-dependent methyltransferase
MTAPSFDPIWEEKYESGHRELYPWDMVVSFVFRNYPRDKAREDVHLLEVGCGTGSNLWFAAREGFSVSGIEGSRHAVEFARKRFAQDGLNGDLRVGDFTSLPFEDESFDLVIDRGALTCCGTSDLVKALAEVSRVLKKGGRFLFNPYADSHSSARAGSRIEEDLTVDITGGALTGVGQIRFASRTDIDTLLPKNLSILSLRRIENVDMLNVNGDVHSMWVVVAQKV